MATVKPRRWFRYSLRTLLVVMTVVCLVSGYWLNKTFRKREAVRHFCKLTADRPPLYGYDRATIVYRYDWGNSSTPMVPEWLHPFRDLIGEEAFGEVNEVLLFHTDATDNDLRYFRDVPSVESVFLGQTNVTDDGLRHLLGCEKLRFVMLDKTAVTDRGLGVLVSLTQIDSLSLSGTKITDAGIDHLVGFPRLKELWLYETAITAAGYQRLKAAAPYCRIHFDEPPYVEAGSILHGTPK